MARSDIASIASNAHLPLALLAGSDHLERSAGSFLFAGNLGSSASGRSLLCNLTPATAVLLLAKDAGRDGLDNALVGELAAANELFGKVAAIHGLRVGVNGIRNDLSLGRQEQQLLDEIVNYR